MCLQKPDLWRFLLCSFTYVITIAQSWSACICYDAAQLPYCSRDLGIWHVSPKGFHSHFINVSWHLPQMTDWQSALLSALQDRDGAQLERQRGRERIGKCKAIVSTERKEFGSEKGHCKDDTGMFALRISSWARSLSAGGHTISFHKTIMHHFCLFIYLSIYLFNQFVLILTVSACHGRVPPELIDRLIVINMLRYEWWGESLHRNTSTQFCLRWNIHLASSKCYIVGNWTCLNLSEFSFFFF